MKRSLSSILAAAALASPALAQSQLDDARKAIGDGLPDVAIFKLRSAEPGSVEATELLGQALVIAGRPEQAVTTLEKLGRKRTADGNFWLAEAQAAMWKFAPALENFRAAQESPHRAEAIVGEARMLRGLGRKDEAAEILERASKRPDATNIQKLELARMMLDDGKAEEAMKLLGDSGLAADRGDGTYLMAWACAESGDAKKSIAFMNSIRHPSASMAAGRTVAQARAYLEANDTENAERVLEDFIRDYPQHPDLDKVFLQLDKTYAAEKAPSDNELRRWSEDNEASARRTLALYFLGRNDLRLGVNVRGQERLYRFITENPDHVFAQGAIAELAQSLIRSGDPKRALVILADAEEERPQLSLDPDLAFVRGQAYAALKDYRKASEAYLASATIRDSDDAWFNAASCAISADISDSDNVGWNHLLEKEPNGRRVRELALAAALHAAGARKPEAGKMLQAIAEGDDADLSARARLALSEWKYRTNDLRGARSEWVRVASTDPQIEARKDALAVFLADTGDAGSDTDVIALAEKFLLTRPGTTYEPEVRMKLAEILFRKGDYQGARKEFETLAQQFPDSELAERASFLAAKSLSLSMDVAGQEDAIARYELIAQAGGPLALDARLEQAVLQYALKRPDSALGIYDRILASKPGDELRLTALMKKGETLFSLAATDPKNYAKAIAVWQLVAADPAASRRWKNEALAKIGDAYRKTGDTDAALAAYYDVLNAGQEKEPEYFWYYKAGFEAGRLFETQKRYKEAIAIYDKLSAIDGPRAEEAKARINRIRLDNFLWED